jgi:hypothetical protein
MYHPGHALQRSLHGVTLTDVLGRIYPQIEAPEFHAFCLEP